MARLSMPRFGWAVAAALALAALPGPASAQVDLTPYPTNIPLSSEMAKLKKPSAETCDRITSSRFNANLLRVYTLSGKCSEYDNNMYWRYMREGKDFTKTVDESNDPTNYFRYHDIDIAPYRAAIARLGFGQHDVGPRGAGGGASASLSDGTAFGTRATPRAATATAQDGLGACGIETARVPAPAQADQAARPNGCAELKVLLSYAD